MLWRFGFALGPSVLSPGFNPAGASGGQPVGECSGATPLEEGARCINRLVTAQASRHVSDHSALLAGPDRVNPQWNRGMTAASLKGLPQNAVLDLRRRYHVARGALRSANPRHASRGHYIIFAARRGDVFRNCGHYIIFGVAFSIDAG